MTCGSVFHSVAMLGEVQLHSHVNIDDCWQRLLKFWHSEEVPCLVRPTIPGDSKGVLLHVQLCTVWSVRHGLFTVYRQDQNSHVNHAWTRQRQSVTYVSMEAGIYTLHLRTHPLIVLPYHCLFTIFCLHLKGYANIG